jgi:hypothetical protein
VCSRAAGLVGRADEALEPDVLLPIGPVEPKLVLEDRAAEIEAVLADLLDVVALVAEAAVRVLEPRVHREIRGAEGRLVLVGDVPEGHVVVGEEVPGAAVEGVRAALGDEVDAEAAGLHRHVGVFGRHVDLVEGPEVEVGGRRRSPTCR